MRVLALTVLSSLALLTCAPRVSAETVEMRTLRYSTTVRCIAFAEDSEAISSPVSRVTLLDVVADGTYVEKGEQIALFDEADARHRLEGKLADRKVAEAKLAADLANIDNKAIDLQDKVEQIEDQCDVQKTRLVRYKALPNPDEVRLAKGKLEVADMEKGAADGELRRAKGRFERGFLSEAELDTVHREAAVAAARALNAEQHYAYAKLNASTSTIAKIELQIENLEMELKKLRHEFRENETIAGIRREGEKARFSILDRQIAELEDDLEQISVEAPIAGHVMHMRSFRHSVIGSGTKLWRGFTFLRIPDPTSLAFKGHIQESERGYFTAGDAVEIRVVERPEEPLQGTLHSIASVPRDQSELDEMRWGGPDDSGVKVYDIVVRMDPLPEWLRYGMHAEVRLDASEALEAPAIPLPYVRPKEDRFLVAVDGVYTSVAGRIVNAFFAFDSEDFLGQDVSLFGDYPQETESATNGTLYRANGELVPMDTTDVVVSDVWGWPKISWIVDEDTVVKSNAVVARLESQDTRERVREVRSRLKEEQSNRKALEEELDLLRRQGAFELARAKNNAAIAKIDYRTTRDGRDWPALFNAELQIRERSIEVDGLSNRVARLAAGKMEYLSGAERKRLRRDYERAALRLEAAQIRMDKIRTGPKEVQLLTAERKYQTALLDAETLERDVEVDQYRKERKLGAAQRREASTLRELARLQEQMEHLTLHAPSGGLVRYARLWSAGSMAKVSVGSTVRERYRLLEIADASSMYVRLEVPEAYYTRVKAGMEVRVLVPALTDYAFSGRVSAVEFAFENKRRKDTQTGIYASQEALGETVFFVRVDIDGSAHHPLKAGAIAEVVFPFERRGEI